MYLLKSGTPLDNDFFVYSKLTSYVLRGVFTTSFRSQEREKSGEPDPHFLELIFDESSRYSKRFS